MTNVLDRLSPGFQAIAAQFTAAGLDLTAILAKGPDGLKQHIESLKGNSSDVASAIEEATKQLQTSLTNSQSQAAAALVKVSTFEAALTKFGAQVKASDEKAGVTAADIEAALNSRSSIKASEQLAKHGLREALPLAPAADATKPATPVEAAASPLVRHYQAMEALPPAEARAYYLKHIKPLQS